MGGDHLTEHDTIELRDPIMVAAFRGWNDAGDAASFAARHLRRSWKARRVASIDPEEFFDFQAVRPEIELVDGFTRRITWPRNEFFAARLDGAPHDAVIFVGTEPNLHWRRFTELIIDYAHAHEVQLVVTLGSLLADVAHTRPVHITGTAADADLIERLGLQRSRYEGPTGIVGVLHDELGARSIASASLWAAVPHYLTVTPNPKAALALVDRAVQLVGSPVDVGELQRAAMVYEDKVSELVEGDEDVRAYVEMLETRDEEQTTLDPGSLPSGEALAAELERYLRERNDDS